VNNNNLWSCDVKMACHMATRLINSRNTSWLMTLTSHHDSCHWFDKLIYHSLASWKYFFPLWLIMIRSSMWWWHGMPFGNKVSQIFMAIHEFLQHHKFLYLEFMAPIFVMTCHNFVCHEAFEVMNSRACVCVPNNLLLICNYDYNINSHF